MTESEEELKSFLTKVKEENENACLKLGIQKTNMMASRPWKECYDRPIQHIKKQRHRYANKGQSYGLSSSHVWLCELEP